MKKTVFVTGATGLLGNNLVRQLLAEGYHVKAFVRSRQKANKQFAPHDELDIIQGDMTDVSSFESHLTGCESVFHTAAFFRDNYKGGSHWADLENININSTKSLLEAALKAGVKQFVHVSSIAVLDGEAGSLIDETCDRNIENSDDYYRSKIISERTVREFAALHPTMKCYYILPGWMWGPGDMGPTSAGQLALDVMNGKLPAIVPGTFSVVDARDVAAALIMVTLKGKPGERYLAAGRHIQMKDLVSMIGHYANVKTPTKTMPMPLLYCIAFLQELYCKFTGKPILLSLASVRLVASQYDRTHFSSERYEKILGLQFRPLEKTLADTLSDLKNR
ncbi:MULTISPECIES: SDR family oxidoreductase [Bartonella]|uniref:SDR family oxidoreductase n=1 Tax=Bartonella TaxID=773 RepID=UPI0018DCA83E|nr:MULTISPECIES: SDR family oxidoreductase [Bartonella]MBI0169831.1 SDR family oxidoreductase [Bartonella sp. W8167]MBI0176191.1 SDR family oxidoreductase [Bartonella apis]